MRYELTDSINGWRLDIWEDDFTVKRLNIERRIDALGLIKDHVDHLFQEELKVIGKFPIKLEVKS